MKREDGTGAAVDAPPSPAAESLPGSGAPGHGAADPVKALMHRHHDLCARAVDPLEIAAGLEAHGLTDRAAGRYRHRDVFSLAEEMYARVPRDDDAEGALSGAGTGVRHEPAAPPGWALFALLPGAACAATVAAAPRMGEGAARSAVVLGGALAVALALRCALRRGPLRVTPRRAPATRAWVCWLLAYGLLGDALLRDAVSGGPDGLGDLGEPDVAPVLALTSAVAPAALCARLLAAGAGRRLAASRGLDEFAASVRPLVLGVVTLFLGAFAGLLAAVRALPGASGAWLAGAGALGALLFLARLLAVHGFRRAPALLLAVAGACEATALALVFAGRLPGCDVLAAPVTAAVDSWGPGVVPAAACGAAALVLLVHAARTLTLASAHARSGTAP
ncbi:hypothetical protein AB0I16_32510 [Streptomyces sp. NPDC050703]|uniref:hypothetical protein n=1 Tax=Streptomyces sp. NPDC050703 TaxID=3157218 RepID=UPI00342CAF29